MSPHSQEGFTLIEILIVVAIIGLLSSIILVGLGSFNARARDTSRITELRQTENGMALYYNKNQRYPDVVGDSWTSLTDALVGGGIGVTKVPNDPTSGQTYSYGVSSDGQSYVLAATLEDSGNSQLQKDVDGTVFSIACDDPVYCVQF